ncbi:PIN domain-containing protein [Nitrosomonas sp. JL21]|uniref:PIN domain-containing protein n=1 Tax=Nitrosomonas sp. JL21 TaxID=153949 RepID=UPI00195FE56C|nr:PIN domain-containing protein [Nitrosomonas sp. JL21]MBL8496692.1 PIN domain-containing protein [Nitrosomonas sp.]MXS76571.1 PIN domain-containing protein [Nitrosomonas sp. JL21]
MLVLVDTSVWIDYFRSGNQSAELDVLIDLNVIVTNDLILAELIPFLKLKGQVKVIKLLNEIKQMPLKIDWGDIIESQWLCLKSGSNGIGIPDLIIAQNAKENGCDVFSLDKHFLMLSQILGVKLYQTQNL